MAEGVIGKVKPPEWLTRYGKTEVGPGFGMIKFFNNLIRLISLVAGLYTLINLIFAGFDFVSSQGDPEKIKNAQNKIWNSLIGLVIIAISFTIAAVVGLIFFDDPTMIISPKIYGPGTE